MTMHEELITKACLTNADFGKITPIEIEVRQSNRAYDYLRRRLTNKVFNSLRAVVKEGRMFIVVPNNL